MEIVRCKRCNRVLTNRKSIKLGYGRICYLKIKLIQEENQNLNFIPDIENIMERIRKLELDNNFMKHQLKHKVYVGRAKDSELDWDIPQEVKEIKNEYKIQFNVIVKELKVIFTEDFDYHNVLKPINVREEPEEPPIIIDSIEILN